MLIGIRYTKRSMETLDRCKHLFDTGKVKECQKLLSSSCFESFGCQQWIKENDLLACELTCLPEDGYFLDASQKISQRLFELLRKMQGLPPRKETLPLELTVCYNHCYTQHMSEADGQLDIVIGKCLARVSIALGVPVASKQIAQKDTMCPLLRYLLLLKPQGLDEVAPYLSQLLSMFSIHLLGKERTKEALDVLSSLISYFRGRQGSAVKDFKCPAIMLPLTTQGITGKDVSETDFSQGVNSKSLVHLLTGLCHYKMGNMDQCLNILKTIEVPLCKNYALYIKAIVNYHQNNSIAALDILNQLISSQDIEKELEVEVNIIQGCCLSKHGKHHCSIQKFKNALALDFNNVIPLYKISEEYRKLQYSDAELESLNLVVTALENQEEQQSVYKMVNIGENILKHLRGQNQLTLPVAIYALAKRCYQLKRYDFAAERYLDLMAHIAEETYMQVSSELIVLPTISTIYHEAAQSLFNCGRYADAILVYDKLISKYSSCAPEKQELENPSSKNDHPEHGAIRSSGESPPLSTSGGVDKEVLSGNQGKKRARSVGSASTGDGAPGSVQSETFDEDVVALFHKSEALENLGKMSEAMECLNRMIICLEKSAIVPVPVKQRHASSEPDSKRRRLTSDLAISSAEENSEGDENAAGLLIKAYFRKATLLMDSSPSRSKEALHFFRLCLQIQPDHRDSLRRHTLLLIRLGRKSEAAGNWKEANGTQGTVDIRKLEEELIRDIAVKNNTPNA